MDDQEIKYLGDLQKLTLAPGDILVLQCDQYLKHEQRAGLAESLQKQFPDGQKVLVLDGGLRLGVLSKEAA